MITPHTERSVQSHQRRTKYSKEYQAQTKKILGEQTFRSMSAKLQRDFGMKKISERQMTNSVNRMYREAQDKEYKL